MLAQKETLQELIMKPGALGYQTSMVSTPGNREKQHQHVHAPSTEARSIKTTSPAEGR